MASATKIAGAGADDNAVGTLAWDNPGYITAADLNCAYSYIVNASGYSHYLHASSFGFQIPDGAVIDGIEVEINRYGTLLSPAGYSRDNVVRLVKDGSVTGSNKAITGTDWPLGGFPAVGTSVTYGGASDLWGVTWAPSEVNASSFGVVLSAEIVSTRPTSSTAFVDYIKITVYYTEAIVITDASASLLGSGLSEGSPTLLMEGGSRLSGVGDMQGSGGVIIQGASGISASGALSADSALVLIGSAGLAGHGVLQGSSCVLVEAESAFNGSGLLSAVAEVIAVWTARLGGSATLSGSSSLVMESLAKVSGMGLAQGLPDIVLGASGGISGAAALLGSPDVLADLSGLLAGSSVMSSGTPVVVVDATMTRKTFVFSGTNRVDLNPYVPIPEKMFSNESFVFEAEINLPAVTTLQTIYSDSANDQFSYDRIVVQGGKLVVQFVNQGANELALVSNRSISPNTWTKVKVVRSGFDFTIYINGEEDASGTWNKGVWSYAPVQQGTANSSLGVTYYAWNFMAPLTGSIRNVNLIPVGFTASGDLSASPLLVLLGEAGLGGSGELSAIAVRVLDSAAGATGAGDLLANGNTLIGLIGRLSGGAQAQASGGILLDSSSSLGGAGIMSAVTVVVLDGASLLGGSGDLGALGQVLIAASGVLVADGLASAETPAVLIEGTSHLSGEGDLGGGEAELICVGIATLDGAGRLCITWILPRTIRVVVDETRTRAMLADTSTLVALTPTRTRAAVSDTRTQAEVVDSRTKAVIVE